MPFTLFAIGWLAFNLVFGAASAFAASRWGRDPFGWLLIGAVLGPIGFLVLLGVHRDDARRGRPAMAGPGARTGVEPAVKVLMATDGSSHSMAAVQYVIEHFGPALEEVTVLSVLPLEAADAVRDLEGSVMRARLQQEIARHIETACSTLRDAGIAARPVTRFGDPADEIIKLAGEGSYDLIVMGRRGRGGVAKLVLGSVSDKVVRSAQPPVMVVG